MQADQLKLLQRLLPITPGINGKEEYLNSAILVLLILINGEYHFVFEQRSANIPQGGEICFPGGRFEPDIDLSPKETALRETTEEMGIPAAKINIIGRLDTVVAPMGAIAEAFVGVANIDLDEIKINPAEVERVITIPVSYFQKNEPARYFASVKLHPFYQDEQNGQEIISLPAVELGLPPRYSRPWGKLKYKILVYQTPQGIVWGLTARFIEDFVKRLNKL